MKTITLYFALLIVAGTIADKDEDPKPSIDIKLESVVERITDLESFIAEQKEVIERQSETIQQLEDRISKSEKGTTNYAFTAFLDKVVTNPVAGQPIKFNRLLTNEGNAYSVKTGIFNCLQDGLYQFSFNIESDSPGHSVTQLVVDSFSVMSAVNGQYQNAGNSAVVKLSVGNQVWVALHGGNATIWNSNEYRYSSFTGVLLS